MKKVSLVRLLIKGWTVSNHTVKDVAFLGQPLFIIDALYTTEQSLFGLADLKTSGFLENTAGPRRDKKNL